MTSSVFSEESNPFLNHVVVERLFSMIPFSSGDFPNLRLVCKLWWKVSLPIWRKTAPVFISGADDFIRNKLNGIHYKKYVDLFKSENDTFQLRRYPFCKFVVINWNLQFSGWMGSERLKFWKTLGPLMRELAIESCIFSRVKDFRKVLFRLTPNLESLFLNRSVYHCYSSGDESENGMNSYEKKQIKPKYVQKNLTKLEICLEDTNNSPEDASDYEFFDCVERLPITWKELLISFPNIETLKLSHLSDLEALEDLGECFEAMELTRVCVDPLYFSSLTELNIIDVERTEGSGVRDDILISLQRLKFPLKKLSLNLCPETKEETFKNFLETHANTLEELTVSLGKQSQQSTSFPNFPFGVELAALTVLEATEELISNLNFLKHTPNLKTLSLRNLADDVYSPPKEVDEGNPDAVNLENYVPIDFIGNTNFKELDNIGLVLPSLEKFMMGEKICSGTEIELLSKLMPNLKHFQAGLENDGFRMVCKVWKRLKHLEIHPFQVDEMGILGAAIGERCYYLPNLLDLTDLKTLKLGYLKTPCSKFLLSKPSIMYGILAHKHLRTLSACLSHSVTTDDEVFTQLKTRFPLRCCNRLYKEIVNVTSLHLVA
ncbi:unnamed protein product [Orchesella dallaii]|uniref:F-box domain-containing protein n=1 Tax=Orchesella dallaii TaxID=48710 RepID=A0ABP1RUT6_9HEXA